VEKVKYLGAFPSLQGAFGGLSPQIKLLAPQIETRNTINRLSFCQFLKCEKFLSICPPTQTQSPPAKTQSPPIENFLARVLPRSGIYRWRKAECQEIDTCIGKTNAVLREFCRSVATKRELANTVKLSVFKSIFVPILTYGHESWVMIERISTQVQAPKMRFLRRVQRVTKGRTEVRLRSGQETSLAPLYLNLRYFGSKCTALKKNLRHFCNFSAPPSESVPGAMCPPH